MTRGDVLRDALSFAFRRERDRARPQGGLYRGRTLRPAERTTPRLRRRIGRFAATLSSKSPYVFPNAPLKKVGRTAYNAVCRLKDNLQ
jgi:hypothetical protein